MKAKLLIGLLIALTLLTGCAQFSTVQQKLPGMPKQTEATTFATTQSILTEMKNPREGMDVSDRYEFMPTAEVTNLGNSDSEGVVCISGLNQDTFKDFAGCDCQYFTLYADEDDGETTQELQFGPYKASAEAETEEVLTATTRYTYETTGYAKACIKKDAYSTEGCQVKDLANNPKNMLTKSTSGAVKISKVTENIVSVDEDTVTLVFSIEVEKARTGDVYDYSKSGYPSCRAEEQQDKKITAEVEGLPQGIVVCAEAELNEDGEGTLTCDAENIRLMDRKGQALFPEGYEPEVTIKLKYGYEQIQSLKFNIVPSI